MKKTIFNIIGLAILGLATISDSGCNQPAGYQPVTVASQQASQQAPQPCVETYPLQQVLAGVHGVDAYGRPLNAWGYPVNVYGEPIETVPCPEVFYHQPGSIYDNW